MAVTNGTCPTYDVLVGVGKVWIAGGGTALPAAETGVSMNTTLAKPDNPTATPAFDNPWRYAGDTTDGVEIAFDRDITEIEVDQYKSPVSYVVNGMTVSVNTNLAAATLDNLKLAWGYGAAPVSGGILNLAEQGGIFCVAVAVVGKAPRGAATATQNTERIYYAKYATNLEASSHSLTKDGLTVFPVSWRVIPDPANSAAAYGSVSDRVY